MKLFPLQVNVSFERETPFLRQRAASLPTEPIFISVKGAEILAPSHWTVYRLSSYADKIQDGIKEIVYTEIGLRSTLASLKSSFNIECAISIPGCCGLLLKKDSLEFEMVKRRE